MRARILADEQALHEQWPEGSMGRAWADLGIAARWLGVEILAACRVEQIAGVLGRLLPGRRP